MTAFVSNLQGEYMGEEQTQKIPKMQPEAVKFLSLGGGEDVTRNMYLYEYKDQILIVDCGLGFPDETMLGVDLLLPDIAYLLHACMPEGRAKKKIVGMVLTHGHEDHIGGLPYILPQLPSFPIYGSPLTAALANGKLTEFNIQPVVQTVTFTNGNIQIGDFNITFIHVTHSIPDTTHLFIETPQGNFYHGADYKFDLTPADRKRTEFLKIAQAAQKGITALLSDCLGSDRPGFTPSEEMLTQNFEKTMRECQGKVFITTNSSNVSRLNQAIAVQKSSTAKSVLSADPSSRQSNSHKNSDICISNGELKSKLTCLVSEAQLPGPRDDVLREHHQPQPYLVVLEVLEREVTHPAVLALADVILDVRVAAMGQVELGDVLAGLVCQEHREPVAVMVGKRLLVAFAQLRAPGDQPRSRSPRGQVDTIGDLDHVRVISLAAVYADRVYPQGFRDRDERLADRL